MIRFSVTYEIITSASAEHGDVADCGVVAGDLSLRDAVDMVFDTDPHSSLSGVEASDSSVESARWFTVYNGMNYLSGAYENRSLHMPEAITASSRRRIARLMGVRA